MLRGWVDKERSTKLTKEVRRNGGESAILESRKGSFVRSKEESNSAADRLSKTRD